MKKITTLVLCFILCFSLVFSISPKRNVKACGTTTEVELQTKTWIQNEYEDILYDVVEEKTVLTNFDRTAGTKQESDFAQYLRSKMMAMSGFSPIKFSGSNVDGFQEFQFVSQIDGQNHVSQNVGFIKKGSSSERKVVLSTNYDNAFGFYDPSVATSYIGEDAGLGSVVTLLSIAHNLSTVELPFDVEILFFGASFHEEAGSSFYCLSINKPKEILLSLTVGDLSQSNIYTYDEELPTKHGDYVYNSLKRNNLADLKKYDSNLSTIISSQSKTYPFTHAGLAFGNENFLLSNVSTVSVFSLHDNGYLNNEYLTQAPISKFNGSSLINTLATASNLSDSIINMLKDKTFESTMVASQSSKNNYNFWTNELMPIYITAIVITVAWLIYTIWYVVLMKKVKNGSDLKASYEVLLKELDKRIEESQDPDLKKNKHEIKTYLKEDIEHKIEESKDKKDEDDKNKTH